MWGFHEGMGWWMVFGGMWMVGFWAIVIGVVVWAMGRFGTGRSRRPDEEGSPLNIAKKRLAEGENSMEEFEGVLSEDEIDAVLGYIKTSWPPEQKALQEEVTSNWQASR